MRSYRDVLAIAEELRVDGRPGRRSRCGAGVVDTVARKYVLLVQEFAMREEPTGSLASING